MPRPGAAIVSPKLYDHLRRSGTSYIQELRIQENRPTRSASGAALDTWVTVFILQAQLASSPVRSGELRREDGTVIVAAHEVELPGAYEVDEKMRVLDAAGVIYEIINVEHASADGRTRMLLDRRGPSRT